MPNACLMYAPCRPEESSWFVQDARTFPHVKGNQHNPHPVQWVVRVLNPQTRLDGWSITDGIWRVTYGGWRVAGAGWRVTKSGWGMANGGWGVTDGGWGVTNSGLTANSAAPKGSP